MKRKRTKKPSAKEQKGKAAKPDLSWLKNSTDCTLDDASPQGLILAHSENPTPETKPTYYSSLSPAENRACDETMAAWCKELDELDLSAD